VDKELRDSNIRQPLLSGVWGGIVIFLSLGLGGPALMGLESHAASAAGLGLGFGHAMCCLIYAFYRRHATVSPPQPQPQGTGQLLLRDPRDGCADVLDAAISWSGFFWMALLSTICALYYVGFIVVRGPSDFFLQNLSLAIGGSLGFGGLFWLLMRGPLVRARVAGSGEFLAPAWPLVPGSVVTLGFTRRLATGHKLRTIQGHLELVWVGPARTDFRPIWTVASTPLGDGGARRSREEVKAAWAFTVPALPLDLPAERVAAGLPSGAWPQWRLRVELKVDSLADKESELMLALGSGPQALILDPPLQNDRLT
jgi:hypothetical protein